MGRETAWRKAAWKGKQHGKEDSMERKIA